MTVGDVAGNLERFQSVHYSAGILEDYQRRRARRTGPDAVDVACASRNSEGGPRFVEGQGTMARRESKRLLESALHAPAAVDSELYIISSPSYRWIRFLPLPFLRVHKTSTHSPTFYLLLSGIPRILHNDPMSILWES